MRLERGTGATMYQTVNATLKDLYALRMSPPESHSGVFSAPWLSPLLTGSQSSHPGPPTLAPDNLPRPQRRPGPPTPLPGHPFLTSCFSGKSPVGRPRVSGAAGSCLGEAGPRGLGRHVSVTPPSWHFPSPPSPAPTFPLPPPCRKQNVVVEDLCLRPPPSICSFPSVSSLSRRPLLSWPCPTGFCWPKRTPISPQPGSFPAGWPCPPSPGFPAPLCAPFLRPPGLSQGSQPPPLPALPSTPAWGGLRWPPCLLHGRPHPWPGQRRHLAPWAGLPGTGPTRSRTEHGDGSRASSRPAAGGAEGAGDQEDDELGGWERGPQGQRVVAYARRRGACTGDPARPGRSPARAGSEVGVRPESPAAGLRVSAAGQRPDRGPSSGPCRRLPPGASSAFAAAPSTWPEGPARSERPSLAALRAPPWDSGPPSSHLPPLPPPCPAHWGDASAPVQPAPTPARGAAGILGTGGFLTARGPGSRAHPNCLGRGAAGSSGQRVSSASSARARRQGSKKAPGFGPPAWQLAARSP